MSCCLALSFPCHICSRARRPSASPATSAAERVGPQHPLPHLQQSATALSIPCPFCSRAQWPSATPATSAAERDGPQLPLPLLQQSAMASNPRDVAGCAAGLAGAGSLPELVSDEIQARARNIRFMTTNSVTIGSGGCCNPANFSLTADISGLHDTSMAFCQGLTPLACS